ncbi:MAG: carbohydrate ABC transporter permease, partial [Anaerolineales bacterium]
MKNKFSLHLRWNSRKFAQRSIQYLILSVVVVLVFIPIVILVFGALKTRGELLSHPYTFPNPIRWENITSILQEPSYSFWPMLRNSLLVMLATTAGVVVVCSLAAFVFARMDFRGKNWAFNLFTLGLMFPINVAILPVYFVLRKMNLVDSLWGVILVQTAFQLSGNIMILRGFFTAVPTELQDAA